MENTSALLFDNSQQKYFVAIEGKALGPLTTQELYEKLSQGVCHFLSFVWCEGWSDWQHLYQVEDFSDLLPKKPDKSSIKKIETRLSEKRKQKQKEEDDKKAVQKPWYLYFGGAQFGPFSQTELCHVLDVHNVDEKAFVWKAPWTQWKRIKEVAEVATYLKPSLPVQEAPLSVSKAKKESSSDKRIAPRKPFVARLFISNDKEVIIAVCRDVSMGGMQVLTDHVPGGVGTKLKLNVSPADAKSAKGFVAEGEIVRVLEDGRGFSFRFTKLSEDAKKTIQQHIKQDESSK